MVTPTAATLDVVTLGAVIPTPAAARAAAHITPTAATLNVVAVAAATPTPAATLPATPVAAVIVTLGVGGPATERTAADVFGGDCGLGNGGDVEFWSSAAVTPAVISLATFQGLT
jgi:hypothetical protein